MPDGVLSFDPAQSIRRFALAACVDRGGGSAAAIGQSQHEMIAWFSIARARIAGDLLSRNIAGPNCPIHLATDPQEPARRNWRGSFGTKNIAAGIMAMLLYFGNLLRPRRVGFPASR